MDSRQTFSRNSQINVTPYIDILLVLLIIFMVIQPLQQFDLEARVPDPPTAEPSAPSPGVFLSLDAESRIELNGESVQLADLGGRLFTILSGRSDRTVFVRGEKTLPFGNVARVIDVAKGAGAGQIGLVLEERAESLNGPRR